MVINDTQAADFVSSTVNKVEIHTLEWTIKLLKKYPVEMVIAELEKYKAELETE